MRLRGQEGRRGNFVKVKTRENGREIVSTLSQPLVFILLLLRVRICKACDRDCKSGSGSEEGQETKKNS